MFQNLLYELVLSSGDYVFLLEDDDKTLLITLMTLSSDIFRYIVPISLDYFKRFFLILLVV